MNRRLRALRESHGLSSTQLSYMLGVNQSTVVRYEKSEADRTISLASLEKYAEALGYGLEYKFVKKKGQHYQKTNSKSVTRHLGRVPSDLSEKMKKEELAAISNMDPVAKLVRAYELSTFVRRLKSC